MPATHSTLHFVNLSTPTEGKDEETRKAVRTHVMQQYIQKKRLRETRRVAKKPSSKRVAQLQCTCARPFSTSSNGFGNNPSVCPTCHGRQRPVAEPALDGGDGRRFGLQQAVTRSTAHRRRHTIHPATILGAGRVDPFGIYPVEVQPYMHDLLDHCEYHLLRVCGHSSTAPSEQANLCDL